MSFILPEIARRLFINETGYSLDEFCESPAKQAEFEAWYNLKLAEPKTAPQEEASEATPEVVSEITEPVEAEEAAAVSEVSEDPVEPSAEPA